MDEEAVLSKTARFSGEVEIGKRTRRGRGVSCEGAAEFADHDDGAVASRRAHLIPVRGQALAELREAVRQLSRRGPLADAVPVADVDEAEVILLAHQPRDPTRLTIEALRGERVAAGREYLASNAAGHIPMDVAHCAVADRLVVWRVPQPVPPSTHDFK